MDSQVRTAKAVVDIDEIHFLNHTDVGGEPVVDNTLFTNTSWYSFATLKGTLEVNQDELSKTMIHIDQSTMPIGISTEAGDFNINFFMPDLKDANLSRWLKNKSTNAITFDGMTGHGFDFTEQLDNMVVFIKAKTGEGFLFPNVQGAVTMGQEDPKVWGLRYNGAVLGASNDANNDIYFLTEVVSNGGSGGGSTPAQ